MGLVKKVFLLLPVILFTGCISYYIGYYGYNKHKIRRFSETKLESKTRRVFLKDLNYEIDIPIIKDVFIEKSYRWGSSYKKTNILYPNETFSINKEPNKLYQIIIDYSKTYDSSSVFIYRYFVCVPDSFLQDTVYVDVFNTEFSSNIKKKYILKIWDK